MLDIPNCNGVVNGNEVYISNNDGASYIFHILFDVVGLYIWSSLFVLFIIIYAFSFNTVLLVFALIFLLLAVRCWYLMWWGGNSLPQRPCKNLSGIVLN